MYNVRRKPVWKTLAFNARLLFIGAWLSSWFIMIRVPICTIFIYTWAICSKHAYVICKIIQKEGIIKVFKTVVRCSYMNRFGNLTIYFLSEAYWKWSLIKKGETKHSVIFSAFVVYTWSIIVAVVCVTRVSSDTSRERSHRWIKLSHFLFIQETRSILKSPIRIISRQLACAADNSSSKRSINAVWELGGRYVVQTRKSLAFGNVISAQKCFSVWNFDFKSTFDI